MSKDLRTLVSVENAAGYALAPPVDEVPATPSHHPETAFRNGHRSAARKTQLARPDVTESRAIATTTDPVTWLQTALTGLRPRRLAV